MIRAGLPFPEGQALTIRGVNLGRGASAEMRPKQVRPPHRALELHRPDAREQDPHPPRGVGDRQADQHFAGSLASGRV